MATIYMQYPDGQVIATNNPSTFSGAVVLKRGGKAAHQAWAARQLREILPPGSTVYTCLRHRSASGMSRRISVHAVQVSDDPRRIQPAYMRDITGLVAVAGGFRLSKDGDSLQVGGCGMDMGFHVVYALSSALYRGNFTCIGERCPSNDHFNGDKNREPHAHSDGGYALCHAWV